MRIALVTEGTRGDVHPMLGLGGLLRARGHEVVVCAPPDFEVDATSRGMEFRAVGTHIRQLLEDQAEAVTGGGFHLLRVSHRYMKQCLAAQFATLPAATEGADLIVGAGVQFAGATAAEIHGVPYRYVVYCPAMLPSEDHPPVVITRQELPRWINRAAWRHVHGFYNLFARRTINRHRAKLGLARVKDAYRHLLATRPILAADAELAPVPLDCPFEVDQIRCLHALEGPALPAKLESFLAEGPPPVYLGFGSMTDSDPTETTRAILAAVRDAGCRALISEGWAGLGEGPLPEGVFVTGPVSHARLFPRVAAVVHHGGAGTTTTAARAGVPQILVPHVLDQFYWAQRVALLGLGPPAIPRRRFCAQQLAESLFHTIHNELLAERTHAVGERMRALISQQPDPALLFENA